MFIPDLQSEEERRELTIDRVGIKGLRYPLRWQRKDGSIFDSVGQFSLDIFLDAQKRGTHMSRFVQLLENNQQACNLIEIRKIADQLLHDLDAPKGHIQVEFLFFLKKFAPCSNLPSYLDYKVGVEVLANQTEVGVSEFFTNLSVCVPVTSLCPCSKGISKYGAHNQRSIVTLNVQVKQDIAMEDLIFLAEKQSSSELFGLLKREDEKFVTERAYENAKFVEDIVRDIVLEIKNDQRILKYTVEVENFESIHNHNAYARIDS